MRLTVCTRPFRAQGPRIEAEMVGRKKVVHSYGHGGSGWSLAWGSAEEAAALALESQPERIAVVGAGAIGLTTALKLARMGVPVTIYAKEFPAESRSARATGTWSPASRIALEEYVDEAFAAKWAETTKRSYLHHQHYVGMDGHPVEFSHRYRLSDEPPTEGRDPNYTGPKFADLYNEVEGLVPKGIDLTGRDNPFPVPYAKRQISMTFNVSEYSRRLLEDFQLLGGRIERAEFSDPSEVVALPAPVIVNCTGYGARALWGDESLTPVRGQISWLAPQPDIRYGVYYKGVSVLSRRDGLILQVNGKDESWGWQIDDETPSMEEFEYAVSTMAPLFENWRG